jgi:DNA repair exonuclease SbcCD ATPase subunit
MNDIKSIKFDSLTMKNFMAYDDFSLSGLSKYKIIFISGKNAQGKSTLTSEAPYFALFGNSLRYKKNSKLLSWYYDVDLALPAYSQLGLVFDMYDHDVLVNIKRHIIGESRYELDIQNDITNDLVSLSDAVRVPDFNKAIVDIFDIDEKKFSILYLKSPFSKPIFETDSDLLSSITKAEYINELRGEFNDIVSMLKNQMTNYQLTIEKQNELAENINKQLSAVVSASEIADDKLKLSQMIIELEKLEVQMGEINREIIKNRNDYKAIDGKRLEAVNWLAQKRSKLQQAIKERDKYNKLIERGLCPTCEQKILSSLYSDNLSSLNESIAALEELLAKGEARFEIINANLNNADNQLSENNQNQRNLNDKIRSLSNMKSQLEANLKNFQSNQSNNAEILKKIRTTIMDLNDELSVTSADYKIMESITKIMLSKNSEYINVYYNNKIHDFNLIFRQILSKMTKGKYTNVSMKLNNKPTLNDHIEYESLSTSERKFIDLSFVMSYIVYLSTKLKLKSFILDEFFDNYDQANIIHLYLMVHEIANKYDLQLFITTNMGEYLFSHMGDMEDVHIVTLTR